MVRRPTLADVASATGVSTAPVSYVLNGKPGQSIPEHTRERVRAAAAELGYVRSGAARALARDAATSCCSSSPTSRWAPSSSGCSSD